MSNDILLPLRGVEVDWQLDSLRLVDSKREIGLLLQVLQTEPLEILLSQRLGIEDARSGGLLPARGRAWQEALVRRSVVQRLISSLLAIQRENIS